MSSVKTVIILAGLLIVFTGAGAGLLFYLRGAASTARADQPPALVEVGAMTVRLADRGAQNEHYIKAAPVLAVCCGKSAKVSADLVYVRDRFVQDASSYTSQDLMDAEGLAKLKGALASDLNQRFHGAIKDVLFNELIVE